MKGAQLCFRAIFWSEVNKICSLVSLICWQRDVYTTCFHSQEGHEWASAKRSLYCFEIVNFEDI